MTDETCTVALDITVNIQIPSDSPDGLATQIVTDALRADDRIYEVRAHTDKLLYAT